MGSTQAHQTLSIRVSPREAECEVTISGNAAKKRVRRNRIRNRVPHAETKLRKVTRKQVPFNFDENSFPTLIVTNLCDLIPQAVPTQAGEEPKKTTNQQSGKLT